MYHVVIAGKPNVGKSTLFNILTRKNKAIVSDIPNVTRDAGNLLVKNQGNDYILTDIGGINIKPEGLFKLTQQKALDTLKKCDLALVLFDIHSVTADDRHLMDLIRRTVKNVIYVANKADESRDEQLLGDLYEHGVSEILPVSCATRKNIPELKSQITDILITLKKTGHKSRSLVKVEKDYDFSICIIGKPNVGKSSLLNYMVKHSRSLVFDESGTTRDSVIDFFTYKSQKIRIIDTAGIRRRTAKKTSIEDFSVKKATSSIISSDIAVLMIDAQEGITEQDKKIAAVAVNRGKGLILAVNKWDLVTDTKWKDYEDRLRFLFPHIAHTRIMPVSCATGHKITELKNALLKLAESYNFKISTSELNKLIIALVRKNPPKGGSRGMLKIFYAVQVNESPPVIRIYVNDVRKLKDNYRKYIENGIKSEKKLKGIPFQIKFFNRSK